MKDGINNWSLFNTNLPSVAVSELEIFYGSVNKLRAGTYGRGLWETILSSGLTLNLNMIIEGFYDAAINQQIADTVKCYLRNTSSPFAIVDSSKKLVSAAGSVTHEFTNAVSGTYYIVVDHRNSIETWSSAGVSMPGGTVSYDFTDLSSKAYGNNMGQVDTSPVRYAIHNGDVIRDGSIALSDIVEVFNKAIVFTSGYVVTDVSGDNNVNLVDITKVYNNSKLFISIVRP